MKQFDELIVDYGLPEGFGAELAPFFNNGGTPSSALNGLRHFLEHLLYHLSVVAGIDEKSTSRMIDRFVQDDVIDRQVAPYLHLWWSISCLGSHFQQSNIPDIVSWNEHLEFCRQAVCICLQWYLSKYPPLNLTQQERQIWLKDASSAFTVPFDQIQICNQAAIEDKLSSTSILLFHGPPWSGKTSIASYLVTDLCCKGFIPLVLHENSLVTFRILPGFDQPDDSNTPKNLRLASNASQLHEIISSRLLYGDSFVIFLDDPFGHRRYQTHNPFMFLRLAKWLQIASEPGSLGHIKIIITTPSMFIEHGREKLKENAKTNPIARENLSLLEEKHKTEIDIHQYDKNQIQEIVSFSASQHGCDWSRIPSHTEFVADTLIEENRGFDVLHTLCQDCKSEKEFLDGILRAIQVANVGDEINSTAISIKMRLCAAYVGEALIEFYREFAFQTALSFDDVCSAAEQNMSVSEDELVSLYDWLLEDQVATMKLSSFPTFLHPEVRCAVAALAESEMRPVVQKIITNLCNLSKEYDGRTLSRWEAVHLACRMAAFITEEQAKFINSEFFFRAQDRGGDPRNIIWAILGNWHCIKDSSLEKYALRFLNVVPTDFKRFTRNFIWEAAENWTHLGEDIRYQLLTLSGKGNSLDELDPIFNEHHTVAFLAAGISQYGAIQDSATAGCRVSEKYIDFIYLLATRLAKSSNTYSSRFWDGLFNKPGSQYDGKEILLSLVNLGKKRGTLDVQHPFVKHVNNLLK